MSEWISVEDKLPEDGQLVLSVRRGDCFDLCFYDHGTSMWWIDDATYSVKMITHWMPLPAPPATEEELHRLKTGRQHD